jgi:hypothetical protein
MDLEKLNQMSDSVTKYFENADTTQPVYLRQTDKIVENVISKYKQRSELGIEKYGTTLHESPDGFYAFLNHLQEELMDATLYIEKLKQQK